MALFFSSVKINLLLYDYCTINVTEMSDAVVLNLQLYRTMPIGLTLTVNASMRARVTDRCGCV